VCPPTSNVADGITTVVQNVTKELAKRGNEVAVYTSDMLDQRGNTSLKPKKQVINNVTVYYLRSLWRHKTFIVTPSIIPLLSKRLSDFDIIHIHDCRSFQGIFAYLFARVKNVPYVFQPHGSYLCSLLDSPTKKVAKVALDKLVSGRIIQNASKIIALSQVEADQYECAGVPMQKITIVPNGIDLTEYSDLPYKGSFKKKFGLNNNEKIVLYLGRIHEIKGIDILVRAFEKILHELGDVRLVIVGPDDGYLCELEALIRTLGIQNNVLIVGPLYGKNKIAAYVDADVYVLPSRYEIFGITVLESVACGTPIIITDACGLADYFSDKVGMVVKADSISQLREALLEMLLNQKRREIYKGNCKTALQKFNIYEIVSQLEKVYEDMIAIVLK